MPGRDNVTGNLLNRHEVLFQVFAEQPAARLFPRLRCIAEDTPPTCLMRTLCLLIGGKCRNTQRWAEGVGTIALVPLHLRPARLSIWYPFHPGPCPDSGTGCHGTREPSLNMSLSSPAMLFHPCPSVCLSKDPVDDPPFPSPPTGAASRPSGCCGSYRLLHTGP